MCRIVDYLILDAVVLRGDVDDVTLAAFVILLLARDHLLREPVDDLQQTDLVLAVLRQIKQPVGPQPNLRVAQM